MKRKANAVWTGTLKRGQGQLSTGSGALRDAPYTFASRFGGTPETNPEELIAAAHAGCFSMALALQLEEAGFPPESIATQAVLTFDTETLQITEVVLDCAARVPGIEVSRFQEIAGKAKINCPVSRVLRANIELTARLGNPAA